MNTSTHDSYSMNLAKLIDLIKKWKNKVALFLIALGIAMAVVLFLKPNEYYSYATAIPTNASLNDKGYIFNEKIDNLYSSLGSFTDLERIYSTAILDTSYKFLIDKYNLIEHYKISAPNKNIATQKAILFMSEENVKVEKTENGLLRIHVTDINADTAASMANALMNYVNNVNSNLQVAYNNNSLQKINDNIRSEIKMLKVLKDSLGVCATNEKELLQSNIENKLNFIQNLEKIKGQFEMTLKFQQPSLRIVEPATPNYKHIKPKRIFSFISTMLLGSIACLILIVLLETISQYKRS